MKYFPVSPQGSADVGGDLPEFTKCQQALKGWKARPLHMVPLYTDLICCSTLFFLGPSEAQETGDTGLILFSQSPGFLALGLSGSGSKLCSALMEETRTTLPCERFSQCLGLHIQLLPRDLNSHLAEENQAAWSWKWEGTHAQVTIFPEPAVVSYKKARRPLNMTGPWPVVKFRVKPVSMSG